MKRLSFRKFFPWLAINLKSVIGWAGMKSWVAFAVGVRVVALGQGIAGTNEKPAAMGTAVQPATVTTQVVAFYFHGTIRCERCLAIEKQAGEVVTNRFGAEVALDRLTFRVVNYDQPKNAHFLKDYKLPCPSLVLVRQKEGKDLDWKLLGQTWEMVEIPPKLHLYIEEELRQFLVPANSPASRGGGTNGVTVPSIGTNIASLAELSTRAAEMNAVMVFLPPRNAESAPSALAAINGARMTLEGRFDIKIGLFTLSPGGRDYDELAPKTSGPAVVAIVKTGVKRCVSGELTEERVIDGFMAAVGAGGCCPLGYPGENQ